MDYLPRYRVNSSDRVRLVYLDKEGETTRPPLGQYLVNTLLPEEEIVHFGIGALKLIRPFPYNFGAVQVIVR